MVAILTAIAMGAVGGVAIGRLTAHSGPTPVSPFGSSGDAANPNTAAPVVRAVCSSGTYRHIPGDYPEFGPPQTMGVGSAPDGIGSVFRVRASAQSVVAFYEHGAGQLNYVFKPRGGGGDPGQLWWWEQTDTNCRGTLDIAADPADGSYTLYSATLSDSAFDPG
ncbi:MAG TPA: hypothetical protein VFO60_11930 [Candidatus Dormibacteraeota bacterium]|nr:hypothetical protein [Candidatus Dormibacteraeota bacterium]